MTLSFHELAIATEQDLWEIKLAQRPKSFWYPYSTLHNVAALEKLSDTAGLHLLELCRGAHGKVADIGAADGDLAFFLERQGLSVDMIDNEYTNFNGLEGARTLKETLNSAVAIQSVDLDSQFSLAGQKYDAVFFSGNPLSSKEPFLPPRKPGSTHEILLRSHVHCQTNRRRSIAVTVPAGLPSRTTRMQQ